MALPSQEIAAKLAGARTPSERAAIVSDYARLYGATPQGVRKAAKNAGFSLDRKQRADAGTRDKPLTDAQLEAVAIILHRSISEKKMINMAPAEAIGIAESLGIIPPGSVSPDYLNAWMRSRNISKADALKRAPHTPLMSLHPNHVHQADASRCAQWYLADSGAVKQQRKPYKNKEGHPAALQRLLLVDHFTGAFFVWYFQSETALDWMEFLYLAWAPKDFLAPRLAPFIDLSADAPHPTKENAHEEILNIYERSAETTEREFQSALPPFPLGTPCSSMALDNSSRDSAPAIQNSELRTQNFLSRVFPFQGFPRIFYTDNGSPIKASATQVMLEKLGVQALFHTPYNPRAKGAVESTHRHWERWFETKLKLHPATSIAQLNAWAFDKCVEINSARIHSRYQRTRFDLWTSLAAGHVNAVPDYEFYRTYGASAPEIRTVTAAGTISYKPSGVRRPFECSGVYLVPDTNLRGTDVEVSYLLYDYPVCKIVSRKTGQVFTVAPLAQTEAGFFPAISATIGESYRSPAHTDSQRAFTNLNIKLEGIEDQSGEAGTAIQNSEFRTQNSAKQTGAQLVAIHLQHLKKDSVFTHPGVPINTPASQPISQEVPTLSRNAVQRLILQTIGTNRADDLTPAQRAAYDQISSPMPQAQAEQLARDLLQLPLTQPTNIIDMEGTSSL